MMVIVQQPISATAFRRGSETYYIFLFLIFLIFFVFFNFFQLKNIMNLIVQRNMDIPDLLMRPHKPTSTNSLTHTHTDIFIDIQY